MLIIWKAKFSKSLTWALSVFMSKRKVILINDCVCYSLHYSITKPLTLAIANYSSSFVAVSI